MLQGVDSVTVVYFLWLVARKRSPSMASQREMMLLHFHVHTWQRADCAACAW